MRGGTFDFYNLLSRTCIHIPYRGNIYHLGLGKAHCHLVSNAADWRKKNNRPFERILYPRATPLLFFPENKGEKTNKKFETFSRTKFFLSWAKDVLYISSPHHSCCVPSFNHSWKRNSCFFFLFFFGAVILCGEVFFAIILTFEKT